MPSKAFPVESAEQVLVCLGYLTMRWNYVEHCARQILRHYAQGGSIDDPDHLAISSQKAVRLEQELAKVSSLKWTGPGKDYLESLLVAFKIAREHRNHLVHGIYETVCARAEHESEAVLIPAQPKGGRTQVPTFVKLSEIWRVAEHVDELAKFARLVMVAFDAQGNLATNGDGSPVVPQLPRPISPLPRCEYVTT